MKCKCKGLKLDVQCFVAEVSGWADEWVCLCVLWLRHSNFMHPNQELHSFIQLFLEEKCSPAWSDERIYIVKYAQVFILKLKRIAYLENIVLIFLLLLSKEN